MTKHERMMIRIKLHGETLLAMFPRAKERDPIKLCKALRRLESKASLAAVNYCNGAIDMESWESLKDSTLAKLDKLLRPTGAEGLFINGDPRGYALKVDDAFTRRFNCDRIDSNLPPLHRDLGGYGILAPDLTNE